VWPGGIPPGRTPAIRPNRLRLALGSACCVFRGIAGLVVVDGGIRGGRASAASGPTGQRPSARRFSAVMILFSDTGPGVPSICANRLTRSSSIIQRTDWAPAPDR
jgi:hypothetical protein